MGGLVAATQLAVKGANVLVLEKYVIPGGSSGIYLKDGYTFDVGSSVMFGFSDKVGTPKTHRRYLTRDEGTYGPMPRDVPEGLLGMPFNATVSTAFTASEIVAFPGQGVIAVAFSGVMCAHRVAVDICHEKRSHLLDNSLLGTGLATFINENQVNQRKEKTMEESAN